MWRRLVLAPQQRRLIHATPSPSAVGPASLVGKHATNVVEIDNATFYRSHPSDGDAVNTNPALFPGLTWSLPVTPREWGGVENNWAILSPSSLARTTFLQIVAGQHLSFPPTARTYPYLSELSKSPQHAIQYVGFDADRGSNVGANNVRGAYLSARYESRREETDYNVYDYLTGHTELNALEHESSEAEKQVLSAVVEQLNLQSLLQMPVANLSNGQTRRTRIAKALMAQPEVLLLDGPYMGLDPYTMAKMDSVLHAIATTQSPRIVLSLRPEDGIPEWITHLVVADETTQSRHGSKMALLASNNVQSGETGGHRVRRGMVQSILSAAVCGHYPYAEPKLSKDGHPKTSSALAPGEALVEMRGVKVAYGDKVVLGDWSQRIDGEEQTGLWWSLHRGQRCGIFGPNGSGKTTMLSLITSDHPQTYSLPIKLFGRSRLPGPGEAGISLFDIQRRMGHSSPEVHAFFPKQLTVRRSIESAWADAPLARAKLTAEADRRVDAILRWFARELNSNQEGETALEALESCREKVPKGYIRVAESQLEIARKKYDDTMYIDSDLTWAEEARFRDLSFSSQRLVLFLRAIVARPDLVILDEALSGIDERVRDKALLFLSHGEKIMDMKDGIARDSVLKMLGEVRFEGLSEEQALLVISHAKEDVPGCVREWICLPEPGEGKQPRCGTLEGPLEWNRNGWNQIWGKE
ncbi:hypothetical protein CLAFUW4_12162 [Fulvia fulva]|uniref:ABC transporter domain-containing protein n=1 Tax=Passalora fulva TaxID=5499 RepID=A0A9Q8PEH2_PASFU|nr:uncharacterized protein CLAFUR5_11199 [Fulvia fulva]KAK4618225.1 hypothetical protein CLAFUR4_12167 [Fulvia fulva]KAK4618603.1 hypothetical protein CLAFUR0_12178 [Fulvia fulva]UJO20988.1 hypothetical protein CLAFUR5_11199 [Fulvia fulva]WPV18111.1 hypothetical protein CLAFUW4_12162 [Fulvia fulva]WPV33427.1 hypothetical protein CLAFUW7_12169 [Fulvia fulva]